MKTPQIPIPKLAEKLGLKTEVWFKREDKHHYGSHKGRSVPTMVSEHYKDGAHNFVISSSGNAALAAIIAIQTRNKSNPKPPLTLKIFVGKNIDHRKLNKLEQAIQSNVITLEQVEKPKQSAHQFATANSAIWLRQSTDQYALIGYHELAEELARIDQLSAVFIPTSSATTAQGLFNGFQLLKLNPQIHIIQTASCHPIVDTLQTPSVNFTSSTTDTISTSSTKTTTTIAPSSLLCLVEASGEGRLIASSIATAIVDQVALRKENVAEAIKNSQGSGFIATNEDIRQAIKLVKETADLDISPNSALSIVGLQKAISAGFTWTGPVVCLITGP